MERLDFSSIITTIRTYISEDHTQNQVDFLYWIYDDFMQDEQNIDFDFDSALVCRWMSGQAKISPRISSYYLEREHQFALSKTLYELLLPKIYDRGMVADQLHNLLIWDNSISDQQKEILDSFYPCDSASDLSRYITDLLCFAMQRTFVKRDTKTKNLLANNSLSPVLADFVTNAEVPAPCRYFCGRDQELQQLREQLKTYGKVFLQGIAGIGKSELAKAYAKHYKKDYTNILYFTYTGNLMQDIIDLDFIDDTDHMDDAERFKKHNRFLRSLKSDTLLIIDNFNVTATKDPLLDVVLKYKCHVIFTTRSVFENFHSLQLTEISDPEVLLSLMEHYYSDASLHRDCLAQIIETVHFHTLAVELSARLLDKGLIEPNELLEKLRSEHTSLTTSDKIGITKDGHSAKRTYYDHIHTLFSLYLLDAEQQSMMRNLSLIPLTGISVKRVADWLNLTDVNTLEDLIESGFVMTAPGHLVFLHPMIQEITVTDLKPSVQNCRTLLSNLQQTCLQHGIELAYHKQLFQTIDNIMQLIENDDPAYYLLFLENVFPYMEKYKYQTGMQQVLTEMEIVLSDQTIGSIGDRSLFLDYQAVLEKDPNKALKLTQKAVAMITDITPDNALLAANLTSNLGGLYYQCGEVVLSKQCYEKAIHIMQQYQPSAMHDLFPMLFSYASILSNSGDTQSAVSIFQKLGALLVESKRNTSEDYAFIMESLAKIYLSQGLIKDGTAHYKKALAIYEAMYADEPELLEAKKEEIQSNYAATGALIGLALQKLL